MARTVKKKKELTVEEKLAEALVPVEERPYQVPENWCWVKLGTLSKVKGGKRVPKGKHLTEEKTSHPYIRVTDFDNLGVDITKVKYIDDSIFERIKNYTISVNDIYISVAGSIGKVGIIPTILDGSNLTENAAKITSIIGYNQKCLLWYLTSEGAQRQMKESTISTTQPKLALFRIENITLPLPPLPEQQRIVDCIESLFAKLDEAKEKAQAVVDGAKERKTSLLFQAFTGKLTEQWRAQNVGKYSIDDRLEYENDVVDPSECPTDLPNSWSWIRMGAVGYTNIGLTYRPSDKSDDGIIVLRSSNIQNGKMDYEDIVRVNMSIPENKMCRKGDLLICARNGSKALVGKTAIVDADGMSYGAFMAIFRSIYNPYIYYFLSSPFFRDLIDKDVGTTTINQVTQAIIKNLPLPFAPKEEQNEIVRILSRILDKEDTIIESATRVIFQIDTMKKSILARAFRGELGTNDPTDESPVELLKRIL